MKKVFDAVTGLDQVNGALILDEEGNAVYDPLRLNRIGTDNGEAEWRGLIFSDNFSGELDLVFEKGRLYLRKTGDVYLLVFMDAGASVASLKLTCDLFQQEPVKKKPAGKRFFSFFSGPGRRG